MIARAGNPNQRFEECAWCGSLSRAEYPFVTCSDECRKQREGAARQLRAPAHYQKDAKRNRRVSLAYYYENRAIINQRANARMLDRYHSDLGFKMKVRLRGRVACALRGKSKGGSAVRDLGCSIEEFITHVAKQFRAGMSWENWGEWHLDHVRPLAKFDLTDPVQFKQAAHYSNYQPLWAADNIRKSDHYEGE